MVMKTFGGGVTEIRSIYDAIVATLAAGIWITLASYSGMPISTTHSAVGGVLGIGLAHTLLYGYTSIRYDVLLKVVISWITSPLSSILLTFIIYKNPSKTL
jgi:PiT family inorganic phosphate transporter